MVCFNIFIFISTLLFVGEYCVYLWCILYWSGNIGRTITTSFRVVDIADIMQITPQVLYRDLKKTCKSIMGKVIEIKKLNGDWDIFNIISKAEYKNKKVL